MVMHNSHFHMDSHYACPLGDVHGDCNGRACLLLEVIKAS